MARDRCRGRGGARLSRDVVRAAVVMAAGDGVRILDRRLERQRGRGTVPTRAASRCPACRSSVVRQATVRRATKQRATIGRPTNRRSTIRPSAVPSPTRRDAIGSAVSGGPHTIEASRWKMRELAGCGNGPQDVFAAQSIVLPIEKAPKSTSASRPLLARADASATWRPRSARATLDGRSLDLAALRGKVVLIDFWATWCGMCRVDMPSLVETYEHCARGGRFEIVGVSVDTDVGLVPAFRREPRSALAADRAGWCRAESDRAPVQRELHALDRADRCRRPHRRAQPDRGGAAQEDRGAPARGVRPRRSQSAGAVGSPGRYRSLRSM